MLKISLTPENVPWDTMFPSQMLTIYNITQRIVDWLSELHKVFFFYRPLIKFRCYRRHVITFASPVLEKCTRARARLSANYKSANASFEAMQCNYDARALGFFLPSSDISRYSLKKAQVFFSFFFFSLSLLFQENFVYPASLCKSNRDASNVGVSRSKFISPAPGACRRDISCSVFSLL